MGELLSEETLGLFFEFVVPGVIILYVRSQFLYSRLPPVSEALVSYILISLVYSVTVKGVGEFLPPIGFPFQELLISVLHPAFIGLFSGWVEQEDMVLRVLRKFNLNVNHPVPSACDWKFRQRQQHFLMVTLDDETKWAGLYGPESFTSSDINERDIYIEKVYEWSADEPWKPRQSGVWINRANVKSIEFWPVEGGMDNDIKTINWYR